MTALSAKLTTAPALPAAPCVRQRRACPQPQSAWPTQARTLQTRPHQPPATRLAKLPHWRTALAALLLASAAPLLLAAPIEVPDPKVWAQLSPEAQAQQREALRRQLALATPAERQAFRQAMRERLQALSPPERQALAAQTRLRWDAMTPEQRQRLAEERRAQVQAMSPEQRRELLQQRRAMLDKLSPEERRALRQKLPTE